eukprot:SAG11_NODE_4368_length_1930_cov_1.593665_2_plen_104_part_00
MRRSKLITAPPTLAWDTARRAAFLAETFELLDPSGYTQEHRQLDARAIGRASRVQQHNSAARIQQAYRARATVLRALQAATAGGGGGATPREVHIGLLARVDA